MRKTAEVPQQTLETERISLVPLADEHFEWEVELDSDPEVMRYLGGRARTQAEVAASHARRIAAAQKVDGLGFWVGLVDDDFVGWWTLQPAHRPTSPMTWAWPIWATDCCGVTGARGSRRRQRASWCATASKTSGSTESSPDDRRQ